MLHWWWSLKTETCRSDIIVYLNVNLKLLTKLINSAFVGVWTTYFVSILVQFIPLWVIYTSSTIMGPVSNPGRDEIFRRSRPALGPTQPPVKWVPSLSRRLKCCRGVLLTTHRLLVPRSWKSRATFSAVMLCCTICYLQTVMVVQQYIIQ